MNIRRIAIALAGVVTIGVFTAATQAAVSYVDADTANTTIDDAAIVLGTNVATTRTTADDLWGYETSTAFNTNGDSVFAAGGTENAGTLKTTVSGLSSATYDVWAYFWSPGNWDIEAKLGANPTVYGTGNGPPAFTASTQTFVGAVETQGEGGLSTSVLYGVYLGQTTGTSIEVLIDNPDGTLGGTFDRTWYDGIGYEFVIPEPASLALLGLGGLMVLRRRR